MAGLMLYDYATASIKEAGGMVGQVGGSAVTLNESCSVWQVVTAREKREIHVPLRRECPVIKGPHNIKIRADYRQSARIIRELLCYFFLGNPLGGNGIYTL